MDQLRARTDDWLVESYIRLRDRVDAIKKRQREELAPLSEMMATIENIMLERLDERGALNTRTDHGTAYVAESVSVTVNAWSKTLEYVQTNELWELLEARVNKTSALAVMEEKGEEIPGVVVRREKTVNIRRTSK